MEGRPEAVSVGALGASKGASKGAPQSAFKREASCALEEAGLFVIDPGEPGSPLWVNAPSSEPVARTLAPRFVIGRSRLHFPSMTV